MDLIVSVSLGSSKNDYEVEASLAGKTFLIRRMGTDGSWQGAATLLQHFDGRAAALALGGVNRRFVLGKRTYMIPSGELLARIVRYSPLADGELWKKHVEPVRLRSLIDRHGRSGCRAVLVSWLDRYHLVEALQSRGCYVLSGDALYALRWPWWQRAKTFVFFARGMMPFLSRFPLERLYPLGGEQEREPETLPQKLFRNISLLVGDTHLMVRRLPPSLSGIGVIASTLNDRQRELLLSRRADWVCSLNPLLGGRGVGANVWEAVALAVAGDRPPVTAKDWLDLAKKICGDIPAQSDVKA